jgi:hypothetical protein
MLWDGRVANLGYMGGYQMEIMLTVWYLREEANSTTKRSSYSNGRKEDASRYLSTTQKMDHI